MAQFATNSLTCDHLSLGIVAALEIEGIHVRCRNSDGVAANRKYYILHGNALPGYPVMHCCNNTFAGGPEHNTHVVTDVPHLL